MPAKSKWPQEGFLGSWVWNKYELFCHLGRKKSVYRLWLPSPRLNIDSSQMTSISEPWHRTLTELMLLFSGLPQELMITLSDYSLPQPYQSAFPCQLLLPWNHTARRVIKALDVLSVSHISSIETSSCYGYLSYQQLWQPVQSNLSLINESFPIWPLMFKLPTVALETFLCCLTMKYVWTLSMFIS